MTTTTETPPLTTVNLWGGTFYWQSTATLTTLNAYAGAFDASGNMDSKTITNLNQYMATVDLQNHANNITITNNVLNYGSGYTTVDPVSSAAISYP